MKSNKKFMLLSAFGIIMVVDAHSWTILKLFTDFLPYNSFFMPMFVFISGYFFSEKSLDHYWRTLLKKVRKLIVPYYLCMVIFVIIETLLRKLELICYDQITPLEFFIKPWQDGCPLQMTAPMWFVMMLFSVQVIYISYRKLMKILRIYRNDYIELVITVIIGLYCVYISRKSIIDDKWLLLVKTGFFMQFLIMGIVYRKHIEQKVINIKKLPIMLTILCINTIRAYIQPVAYNIACNDLATMTGFHSEYIATPLISSLLGIIFWLCVADILVPAIADNKLINYISNNTFFIMATHIFCFNILNGIFYAVNKFIVTLPGLNLDAIMAMPLYRYEPLEHFRIFYFIFGLFGSVLIKKIYDNVSVKVYNNICKIRKQS